MSIINRKLNFHNTLGSDQQGVALIEILVTIVVIAIGLLGLISLQTRTMLTATQANQYYVASSSVQDMAERIRANVENAGSYDNAGFDLDPIIPGGCGAVCTIDINDWHNNLAGPNGGVVPRNGIAGAEGNIEINNTPVGLVAAISVSWLEHDDPINPYTYTLDVPLNPNVRP